LVLVWRTCGKSFGYEDVRADGTSPVAQITVVNKFFQNRDDDATHGIWIVTTRTLVRVTNTFDTRPTNPLSRHGV
jgi:hypothetical protein